MSKNLGKGHRLIDLTGLRFGRLLVLKRCGTGKFKQPRWKCRCDCGREKEVNGQALRSGLTISCGCYCKEQNVKRIHRDFPDPISHKHEYQLWQGAKFRAKRDKVPFDITYKDIVIPEKCPVLNIELKCGVGKPIDNSPTVDKILPRLGYVRGNVQVISFKANSIKRDATIEELRKVLAYVELKGKEAAYLHQ